MATNVYVTNGGSIYSASSPGSASDSVLVSPSAYLLSACTGTPVAGITVRNAAAQLSRNAGQYPSWFTGQGSLRLLP